MRVTAWNSGGNTYGIRIGFPNRDWFAQQQLLDWPRNKPPAFELHQLNGNHFRLTR